MEKFVLVAAAIGVLLLSVHLWSSPEQSLNTTAAPETATPSAHPPTLTTQSPPTATPAATPTGSKTPRPAWEPTVQGFALAYPDTNGLTRQQWLTNLRPYLAHDVLVALADTDLDHIPTGHYAGYQTLTTGDHTTTAVRVTYQEGWALVLYLSATKGHWHVSALDLTSEFDD